jgi:glycosyltransferase involved in cell wall biosynthesis
MKRKVIAYVSVLKPVDDSRTYEKIALSIGQTNKYDQNIIGFRSKNIEPAQGVAFHPLFAFPRLSLRRALAQVVILKKLVQLKPQLIVSNTYETLAVIVLYKILFGAVVLYDVQEDYYRNIRYASYMPAWQRWPLSHVVRLVETCCAPAVDCFLLAEKTYRTDLPFVQDRPYIMLENKHLPTHQAQPRRRERRGWHFLYTGTIAENYGIFDALAFMDQLHQRIPEVRLTIAGFCASSSVRKWLYEIIDKRQYISTIGIDALVPHARIMQCLQSADYALLPYQTDPIVARRIPTKLYTCIYLKIPILIRDNPVWHAVHGPHGAAIVTDFDGVDDALIDSMQHGQFYSHGNPEDVIWKAEGARLRALVDAWLCDK